MKHPTGKDLRFTHNRWGDFCTVIACLFIAAAGGTICHAVADLPLHIERVYTLGGISAAIGVALIGCGAFFVNRVYVVASSFSLDIIPLYRPRQRTRIIPWGEIASAQVRGNCLLLSKEDGSCEQVSMHCMRPLHRHLLLSLVRARLEEACPLKQKPCP